MNDLTAIILAAGKGTRLGTLTDNIPKPMIEVNEIKIIDNLISLLIKNNFRKVVVVTGFLHQTLSTHLQQYQAEIDLVMIENKDYASTNNIYSLWLAQDHLKDGFYLFEADIFFEEQILSNLVNSPNADIILLGKHNSKMDGTVVELDDKHFVENMYLKRHQREDFDFSNKYKTVNFYKISPEFTHHFFLDKLKEHIKKNDLNSYYELIIAEAIRKGYKFYGLTTENLRWWEIDTQQDLQYCEAIFSES